MSRICRATLASGTVMIAQQMNGINNITLAVFGTLQALLVSWDYGLDNFVLARPAIWTIDTYGWRTLLPFTSGQMTWSLLLADLQTEPHFGLVALFVHLLSAFNPPGERPMSFTYSAEVFRLSHREVGMSWRVAMCFFWSRVLSVSFHSFLTTAGNVGVFGFYP